MQISRKTRADEVVKMILSSYGSDAPPEKFVLVERLSDSEGKHCRRGSWKCVQNLRSNDWSCRRNFGLCVKSKKILDCNGFALFRNLMGLKSPNASQFPAVFTIFPLAPCDSYLSFGWPTLATVGQLVITLGFGFATLRKLSELKRWSAKFFESSSLWWYF